MLAMRSCRFRDAFARYLREESVRETANFCFRLISPRVSTHAIARSRHWANSNMAMRVYLSFHIDFTSHAWHVTETEERSGRVVSRYLRWDNMKHEYNGGE